VSRVEVLLALALWLGATLLFAELRAFRRLSLRDRLRPHVGAEATPGRGAGVLSVASVRDVIGPLVAAAGAAASRALGIDDDLSLRLRRAGSPHDPTTFRLRQAAWTAAGSAVGLAVGVVVPVPPLAALGLALGGAVLSFLLVEQRVLEASARRQAQLRAELPVVAEQIGMLLGAGYSLGAALGRVARRGNGVCAADLSVAVNRVRQGLSDVEALREWAAVADVAELHRLVSVLALNSEASDAGRLIGDEARSMRADAHRRTVELMERRAQMVWVPVTVATLVPGVVLMAIPFLTALRDWSAL
jgi:Flp pilus assembly protein TadB